MISDIYRCVFIHIPKCGGTSIEDIIWPMPRKEEDLWMGFINKFENKYQTGGLQHLKAWQVRDEVGEDIYNSYFKFTFVRNPWDKAVSQFSYMKDRKDLRDFIGMKEKTTFKEYLYLIQKKKHIQWEPQYDFIFDRDGNIMVDKIGRLETFESDVKEIIQILGLSIDSIPHAKKSKRKNYEEYYDDESREIVLDLYRKDVEFLGYSF